jgi:16S rRNA (cytosine967-C5)-methyltransferase
MKAGGRLQAAIEVLGEILGRGRAANVALADWGNAHRFAGSGDRGAIGSLVFDVLRKRNSLAWRAGSDTPRSLAFAALHDLWGTSLDALASLCAEDPHSPPPLTGDECKAFAANSLADAPPWVRGDYPEWLHPHFERVFGEQAAEEGQALAERAPIDVRVNTLKATRGKVLNALSRHSAISTPYSPIGVRIPAREGAARSPNIEADPAFGRGFIEIQDEGSQIAALLAGASPRMQVLDLCAGAGGKTLAFAAQMQNTGQIFAYDADPARFRPIYDRLKRAGARNVQTLAPGNVAALNGLGPRFDLVLIDSPCSGTGVWRRRPDSKWRLTPQQLDERMRQQTELLDLGSRFVKPGGSLAYVTCSVLAEENADRISAFLDAHPGFAHHDLSARALGVLSEPLPAPFEAIEHGLLLTPARHGTDGFFVALLERAP